MENVNDIELRELLAICIKKWWLIVMLTVLGCGIAYFVSIKFVTPVYEAKTVLYIGQENGSLGGIDISLGQLNANSQLIIDYKQLALTRLVTGAVIKNSGLNISYDDFQKNVVIESITDSRLFTVGYRNPNPEIAKKVADELAKQLTIAVLQIVGVENIRILDQASLPDIPVSPNKYLNALIGGILGLFIALLIIYVMFLVDDTIKGEEDIENLIGLSALGAIPEFKGEVR